MSRGRALLTSVSSCYDGRISPDSSRPACGRHLGSPAGRPVRAHCVVGFRCTVLLIDLLPAVDGALFRASFHVAILATPPN
ncbi:hypothetical protein NDU88_002571 [Pleurodeles waltl]|uniref:Uncharacterized protein n=1 Tax=Pleurodeles waltl TaxID=8319 RepID=A0AAV7SFI9_PLEWA|nr:hypothetical protein NDU88_002571 [Pleurodeles waltl]